MPGVNGLSDPMSLNVIQPHCFAGHRPPRYSVESAILSSLKHP